MLLEARKEGFRLPGVGVADICEPLTRVLETDLGNSRKFSCQLSLIWKLSSPVTSVWGGLPGSIPDDTIYKIICHTPSPKDLALASR